MMKRVFAALAAALAFAACSQDGADARQSSDSEFTEAERAEIRELARDYILENPEIIEEALIELQRRARAREMEAYVASIERNADAIYNDPRDPAIGPEDADVVVVEFMDYKCGYCRIANRWVDTIREQHGDRVRFVFKEYPILGEESREAARAALAALRQGEELYFDFHTAMIQASGPLPSDRIDSFAAAAGIDVRQMREDMEDPAIEAQLEDVYRLGRMLGADGTPFFIVDGTPIPGANMEALNTALEAALEG